MLTFYVLIVKTIAIEVTLQSSGKGYFPVADINLSFHKSSMAIRAIVLFFTLLIRIPTEHRLKLARTLKTRQPDGFNLQMNA